MAPNLQSYDIKLYQPVILVDSPLKNFSQNLMSKGGVLGGLGSVINSSVDSSSLVLPRLYFVFTDEMGWNVEYELGDVVRKSSAFESESSGSVSLHGFLKDTGLKIVISKSIEELADYHVLHFGGTIVNSRMGPVIEHSANINSKEIQDIIRQYSDLPRYVE